MRIGIVVNPDAGLGGRLGFKGSDGRAAEARAAGAEDRAGPRMLQTLEALKTLLESSLNRANVEMECIGWQGRMGGAWMPADNEKMSFTSIGRTPEKTSETETSELVRSLVESGAEAILYAGGDAVACIAQDLWRSYKGAFALAAEDRGVPSVASRAMIGGP